MQRATGHPELCNGPDRCRVADAGGTRFAARVVAGRAVGGFRGYDDSLLGLWVFEVATGRAKSVLEGHCTMPSWSRDGRWLAFDERTNSRSIWIVGRSYIDGLLKDVAGATSVPSAR